MYNFFLLIELLKNIFHAHTHIENTFNFWPPKKFYPENNKTIKILMRFLISGNSLHIHNW